MTLNRGIALSLLVGAAAGFAPLKVHHPTSQYSFELSMAPRFDPTEQKWYPSSDEDGQSAGYPPIGSLFRQGPKCFFTRIFTPDQYEQSVLKYMSQESCSRNEAQGNMDG